MKLLKLTDGLKNTGFEEYVEVDEIARIETFTYTDYVPKQVKVKGFFGREKTITKYDIKYDAVGAIIYMKTKGKTYVKESPAQVLEMIKNKQYVEA